MRNSFRARRGGQEGVALLLVILATIIVLGALALVAYRVIDAKRFTDVSVNRVLLDEACKAGVDFGIEQIWGAYMVAQEGTPGNLASYKEFIDGVVANNEDLNGNGTFDAQEGEYDSDADGSFEVNSPQALIESASPLALGDNDTQILTVTVSRADDLTGCSMTVRATGKVGDATRTVEQTLRVSSAPFDGFEYAVLANNINCILCHAEFRALDLEYNTDASDYDSFKRIKVAALESMLLRPSEAASRVAGTVYTRGTVTNQTGSPLSSAQLASSTFKGYSFDHTTGNIEQTSTGAMGATNLVQAQQDANGYPLPMANLYKNYPTDETAMKDGNLPLSFPAPYSDVNENRQVDDWEFAPVMNTAIGGITGGIAFGVAEGQSFTGTSLPTTSNTALADLGDGTYTGNVILVGTDANPIVLNGTVAIDGDLVLSGKVKGAGKLMVRRNTYVVGDVTYADAPGEFGVAADGGENAMALVSGGSIMMGDYVTIRGKNHTQDTSQFPDSGKSIKVRLQNVSANVTKNSVTQTLRYGYNDPGVVDAGEIQTTMPYNGNQVTRTGQQYSFTTSELMLFNNLELEKAVADPTYKPRFYGLRDSQPNNVYVYDAADEHAVRYDISGGGVKLLSDYLVQHGLPLDIMGNAAVHYMNPDSNWISEETLRELWWDDEQSRPSSGRPFKFDGLLYSNNAIFAITRSRSRHGSYSDGKMHIRGAVIAPDLGVLIPGNGSSTDEGLRLLYDRRVKRFYQLEDTTQVAFNRLVYRPLDEVTYAAAGGN